jgi:thymidylate synthase (FAD)
VRHEEIEVQLIAHTSFTRQLAEIWLKRLGVSPEACEELLDFRKPDGANLVEVAGRRCYKSFEAGLNPNVTKIRKDLRDYLDNVLRSGHGSVLEHATYTFAIENVSRVFTAEMNRHRAGVAISEGSMRYIALENVPYWVPFSIRDNCLDDDETAEKKQATRAAFDRVFRFAEDEYRHLVGLWDMHNPDKSFPEKKALTSALRRIIPIGVSTGGIWTFNLRALRHIIALRSHPAAEEEIAYVFHKVGEIMKATEPEVFADFEGDAGGYWVPKYAKV